LLITNWHYSVYDQGFSLVYPYSSYCEEEKFNRLVGDQIDSYAYAYLAVFCCYFAPRLYNFFSLYFYSGNWFSTLLVYDDTTGVTILWETARCVHASSAFHHALYACHMGFCAASSLSMRYFICNSYLLVLSKLLVMPLHKFVVMR
jgi:hypothetical protein